VLLAIKATNSSYIAWHKFRSMRVTQMDEGIGDKADAEVDDWVSVSAGSQKPRFTHVVIG
jgi:hypothetical protein